MKLKLTAGLHKLTKGFTAPDFTAQTREGKTIKFSDYRGKIVWLIFYRYPGCPICNLHVSALYKRYDWVRDNKVSVITVFESPRSAFPESFGGKPYPNFPFIADPSRELYNLFRVEKKIRAIVKPKSIFGFMEAIAKGEKQGPITGSLGQLPAHFLIAEDGVIDVIYYGDHIADHIPWEEVEEYAKKRKIGNWNPKGVIL